MYVCNCKGLRERDVRGAIDAGARHVAHVFHACGERPQCARCVHRIVDMIRVETPGTPRRADAMPPTAHKVEEAYRLEA